MNIYYNKHNFETEDNLKEINNIITNINQLKYKFNIDNNNYNLFKIYSSLYCLIPNCNKFNCKNGFCYTHFSKKNNEEYVNICISEIKNNNTEIKKIENKYRIFFAEQIKYYCILNRNYLIYLYNNCNFNIQKEYMIHNQKYINNKHIDYESITVKFDKNIINKIKLFLKNNDINTLDRDINIYNIINLLHKKFLNYQHGLSNFIYNIKNNKSINTNLRKIENNIILYNRILESHLIKYIDYINIEHSLYISNHVLRADIYLILCIDNNYFEMIIETDEDHHITFNEKYNEEYTKYLKYDYYKDKYAIKKGISFVRIDINNSKINDENIDLALFCINYIIETQKPLYYFNKKYINYKKSINIDKYNEFSDIESDI
jgi:hypothetical protein